MLLGRCVGGGRSGGGGGGGGRGGRHERGARGGRRVEDDLLGVGARTLDSQRLALDERQWQWRLLLLLLLLLSWWELVLWCRLRDVGGCVGRIG